MRPPTKIGSVVDSGRYAPTANASERTPHSSMVTLMNTPTSTNCQSRFLASSPLMSVAMSVPCGAGNFSEPMACVTRPVAASTCALSSTWMVSPMASDAATAPIMRPTC